MIQDAIEELETKWSSDNRWSGIERTYTAEQVVRLRGSVVPEHTIAKLGAERLWQLLQHEKPVRALGALTGGQAVQTPSTVPIARPMSSVCAARSRSSTRSPASGRSG